MSARVWVVCAARFELPEISAIPLKPVGIGLLPAMSGLSRLLTQEEPPVAIVLAGTAGLLQKIHPSPPLPMPPMLSSKFIYPQYRCEEIPEVLPSQRSTGGFAPLDRHVCADVLVYSTFGVTHDASAMEFHNPPATLLLENLEALGLAELCHAWKIPFYALLAVTNLVGPQGRGQWRSRHRAAGELLALRLRELLGDL